MKSSEKEIDNFFDLLLKNESLFVSGHARLVLTAAVLHQSMSKLDIMRNARRMKLRERAIEIRKVFERVVDLKISHYDVNSVTRRVSSLRGTIDLSIFRSLRVLTLHKVPLQLTENLEVISANITEFRVHRCLYSLADLQGNLTEGSDRNTFPKWSSLEVLDLSNNWLKGLDEAMKYFASDDLHSIYFSYNQIEDFYDNLVDLPVVKRFDASFNRLLSIPRFAPTVKNYLSKLVLCSNRIESVAAIAELFYLEFIDLRDNLIAKHSDLAGLEQLHILKHILLSGNPLCKHSNHLTKTMNQMSRRALSNLPIVDRTQITVSLLDKFNRNTLADVTSIFNGASSQFFMSQEVRRKTTTDKVDLRRDAQSLPSSRKPSMKFLRRPTSSNKGVPMNEPASSSAVPKSSTKRLTIPGNIANTDPSTMHTSTPRSPKKMFRLLHSPVDVAESPVLRNDDEADNLIQKFKASKDDPSNVAVSKLLNELLAQENNQHLGPVHRSSSSSGFRPRGDSVFQRSRTSKSSLSGDLSDVTPPPIKEHSSFSAVNTGKFARQNLFERSHSVGLDSSDEFQRRSGTRKDAIVELCSIEAFEFASQINDGTRAESGRINFNVLLRLELMADVLMVFDSNSSLVDSIPLKKIGDVTVNYLGDVGDTTNMAVLQIHFPMSIDSPLIEYAFLETTNEVTNFINKLKHQTALLNSPFICPKCGFTLVNCNGVLPVFCTNCCLQVTPQQKSNVNLSDYFTQSNSKSNSKLDDEKSNIEHHEEKSNEGSRGSGSEPVEIEGVKLRHRKTSNRRNCTSNRESRTSQIFQNSFTQDGKDLHALKNVMDGFVDPILELEYHLDSYLVNIFEEDEHFQQMFKGYLSTSERPEIFSAALVITSEKIRFFEIRSTDKKQQSIDLVESWFVPVAAFPFDTLSVLESGIGAQSMTFKFSNSAKNFVFVAFSREIVNSIVDVVMRLCLEFNWTRYQQGSNTWNSELKMLDKYVLSRLKLGSGLTASSTSLDCQVPASVVNCLKEQAWICRCVGYPKVLVLLAIIDSQLIICAVNFFVVKSSTEPLRSKPFVFLDSKQIKDVSHIQRYRNRRNVITVCFFDKVKTSNVTSSVKPKFYNSVTGRVEWSLKLGNMKQISQFVNIVQEKWEASYCTSLNNEVVQESKPHVTFFDD